MVLNMVSPEEFTQLVSMVAIPCIIVKNNPKDGLVLAAYQFAFKENGNGVLILLNDHEAKWSVGDCVRAQHTSTTKFRLQPSTPIATEDINDLAEARAEYLPGMFGN